eukprot:CAMPEP_0181394076 /NCGR_PEP_ID=MMETSP1106-20121128/27571_1 /TAXON_ID=81844 /ORGANISM="Mantoniella antarctica, Strain SL-175" /LENGTH=119 /DNA_ID=CAMNT_0023515521 /DNA_START=94 /DNA_END=450 /DNA_ORIENTATION=+
MLAAVATGVNTNCRGMQSGVETIVMDLARNENENAQPAQSSLQPNPYELSSPQNTAVHHFGGGDDQHHPRPHPYSGRGGGASSVPHAHQQQQPSHLQLQEHIVRQQSGLLILHHASRCQ